MNQSADPQSLAQAPGLTRLTQANRRSGRSVDPQSLPMMTLEKPLILLKKNYLREKGKIPTSITLPRSTKRIATLLDQWVKDRIVRLP